jgi:hypothetical protein
MKRCLLLLFLVIPLASAFCEEGTDLKILLINDTLYDNDIAWNWRWGERIELEISIKSYLERDNNFTAGIYFINDNGEISNISINSENLERRIILKKNETNKFIFHIKLDENRGKENYTLLVEVKSTSRRFCTSKVLDKKVLIDKKGSEIYISSISGPSKVNKETNNTYIVTMENLRNNIEKDIKLYLINSAWKINEESKFSLEPREKKNITFQIFVPENATGFQNLYFYALYQYRPGKGRYLSSTTEDGFDKRFSVEIIEEKIASQTETEEYSEVFRENISKPKEPTIVKEESTDSWLKSISWFYLVIEIIVILIIIAIILFLIIRRKS